MTAATASAASDMLAKTTRERSRDFQGMREQRRSEPMTGPAARGASYLGARSAPLRGPVTAPHAGVENAAPSSCGRRVVQPGGARPAHCVAQPFAPPARTGLRAAAGPSPGKLAAHHGIVSTTRQFGADITNNVNAGRGNAKALKASAGFFQQQPQPVAAVAVSLAPPSMHTSPGPLSARALPPVHTQPLARREDAFNAVFQGDGQDIQRVSEYAADIFERLFQEEESKMPRPNYMDGQADINGRMRAILIDWLVEVHMKYRLKLETLYLTVNIIDRYLSVRPVVRKQLQLLGVVAMFIASKYEEIDMPKAAEFAYITDNSYTKNEVLNMECTVLAALDFEIVVPTQAHFLDRLERVNGCDAAHRSLVHFLLELALVDISMIRYAPSFLASAAILLSNDLLGHQAPWSPAMAHHARRSEAELRGCAAELRTLLDNAPKANLQAVRRKYQSEPYHAVANMRLRAA